MSKNSNGLTDNLVEGYLEKRVWVWCANYIYLGTLIGYSDSFLMLKEPYVVYQTGDLCADKIQDAQPLPDETLLISRGAIESLSQPKRPDQK